MIKNRDQFSSNSNLKRTHCSSPVLILLLTRSHWYFLVISLLPLRPRRRMYYSSRRRTFTRHPFTMKLPSYSVLTSRPPSFFRSAKYLSTKVLRSFRMQFSYDFVVFSE